MQVCNSLQTDNHSSTPPLCFLQAGCPSCRPTNSIKALKAQKKERKEKERKKRKKLKEIIISCLSWLVFGLSRVYRPTRHNIGHFGGGLHSQSLDWYWQTEQYRKIKINKLNTNQKKVDNLKYSKTKLPWFSCLLHLQHSARKRDGLILRGVD